MNKTQAEAALRQFVETYGRLPLHKEFKKVNGLPAPQAFEKAVGMGVREYEETHFPELRAQADAMRLEQRQNLRYTQVTRHARSWNAQEAEEAVRQFVEQHGRLPHYNEFGPSMGLPSGKTFERLVGLTLTEYKERFYPELVRQAREQLKRNISAGHLARHDAWSTERALSELERFVREAGRFPINEEMGPENDLPTPSTFQRFCGLTPHEYGLLHYPELVEQAEARRKSTIADKNRARAQEEYGWTEETVLTAVERFLEQNGRLPVSHEHTAILGLPTSAVYLRLFDKTPPAFYQERYPTLYTAIEQQRREKISRESKRMWSTSDAYRDRLSQCRQESGWDGESVLQAVDVFIRENGRLPLANEFRTQNGLPCYMTFCSIVDATPREYFMSRDDYQHYFQEKKQQQREQRCDAIRQQIDGFIEREKRNPHWDEFTPANGLPSYNVVSDALGMTLSEYFEENYPEYHQELKPYLYLDRVLTVIQEYLDRFGDLPWSHDFTRRNGLPNYHSILSRFGLSPNQFLERFFPDWFDRCHRRPVWSPPGIERQVTAFYEEHGRPPYSHEFYNKNGLPTMTTFLRHMKELPTAYCLRVYADYFATRREAREQFILESFESWIRRNRRHPSNAEIHQDRLPSYTVVKNSFHCTITEFLQQQFPEYPNYMCYSKEDTPEDVETEKATNAMGGMIL